MAGRSRPARTMSATTANDINSAETRLDATCAKLQSPRRPTAPPTMRLRPSMSGVPLTTTPPARNRDWSPGRMPLVTHAPVRDPPDSPADRVSYIGGDPVSGRCVAGRLV